MSTPLEKNDDMVNKKSLKSRMARGGAWLTGGTAVEQGARLIRNIVFAKILAPDFLAPFVIIQSIYFLFESFSELGIREAIIQNPEGNKDSFLNSAWWIASARGIVMYIISAGITPLLAIYVYEDISLIPLFLVAFLNILFRGVMSTGAYRAVKQLDFKKYIFVEQLGGLLGAMTAIIMVFVTENAWALVLGFVVEGFSRTILSFIVFPIRPKWSFNKDHTKALYKFILGMFGLPIFAFLFMKADTFFLTFMASKSDLGLYGWVANLALLPTLMIQKLLNPLLMPAFSEMQEDKQRMNKALHNFALIFSLVSIPIIFFMAFFGKPFLTVIFDAKWQAVHIPFVILFSSAILRNYNVPIVSVYMSLGQPGKVRIFTMIRALLVGVLLWPGIHFFGLVGAASAVITGMAISFLIQLIMLKKFTKINLVKYWSSFLPGFIISLPIIGVWPFIRSYSLKAYYMMEATRFMPQADTLLIKNMSSTAFNMYIILLGIGIFALLIGFGMAALLYKKKIMSMLASRKKTKN